MPLWKNCFMEILYFDDDPFDSVPCQVVIDGDNISLSYKDEDLAQTIVCKGFDHGAGHFELSCPEAQGRATLHRLKKDSSCLEGFWKEGGERGMWRITLA